MRIQPATHVQPAEAVWNSFAEEQAGHSCWRCEAPFPVEYSYYRGGEEAEYFPPVLDKSGRGFCSLECKRAYYGEDAEAESDGAE